MRPEADPPLAMIIAEDFSLEESPFKNEPGVVDFE
jgi:hypothetical protein